MVITQIAQQQLQSLDGVWSFTNNFKQIFMTLTDNLRITFCVSFLIAEMSFSIDENELTDCLSTASSLISFLGDA